ncbi:hypothetical protein C4546_01275 [Candidatus Parcubacteria bacterium]|jgi:hypothetical protein|nr:MAG: hypothetical protein C4546_01275 [Candidatus Parcubacteria bacterium]
MSSENFERKLNLSHEFNNEDVDFGKKRFKFWLENVPKEIRRYEYELWKLHRKHLHRKFNEIENSERIGRFTKVPEFTPEDEERYWLEFSDSFLKGKEREERFKEIFKTAKNDLPNLVSKYNISNENVQLIALSGSSLYGPRKEGSKFSDIDTSFLIDDETDLKNSEFFPEQDEDEFTSKYHLIGTGNSDLSRGERNEIHWLLYPHYPILTRINEGDLEKIIEKLSAETLNRKVEIETSIQQLQKQLLLESNSKIFEKYG